MVSETILTQGLLVIISEHPIFWTFDEYYVKVEYLVIVLIRYNRVPDNVHFEVDDVEAIWVYPFKFDFIHCRSLYGAVSASLILFKEFFVAN